jgi:hypothetical protein
VQECGFRIERVDYHNLVCLKELSKVIPAEMRQSYAAWWLGVETSLNEQFLMLLPEAQYGDNANLWRQMVSRTLCLRHA